MNDETIEFLSPYLELEGFGPLVARNASKAAEGLCAWCIAMTMYHAASKIGEWLGSILLRLPITSYYFLLLPASPARG